jgi:malate dehydrogenase (oxaloacetate-decarboxylating)(NADP+)
VFDLELDAKDPDEFIRIVKALEPTFGGINLEDIKAPECFVIEDSLKRQLSIPVFHDDQHGTAIISGAALLNAAELQDKPLDSLRIVFSGAGAAAISCARHYIRLGARPENILMADSTGVVYEGRTAGMNIYKKEFARKTAARTLAEALSGADVFVGLSQGGLVSKDMVQAMAHRPIIFAMANPDPEIGYQEALQARPDCIMATGRSDFPNQVNNVLGFPFIFRGALDVRAREINEPMKVAATRALSALAQRGDVPDDVCAAYNVATLVYGPEYIIPKPLDGRVLVEESIAVAQAAMDSGVATQPIRDMNGYRSHLEELSTKIRPS